MMGLVVLAIMAGYLFVCWLISLLVASIVYEKGGNGKRWGHITLGLLFSMIFWYALAVEVVFWSCCAIGHDMTIYKTLEEWKRENPGVAETLNPDPEVSQSEYLVKTEGLKRFYRLPGGAELVAHYGWRKNYLYTHLRRSDGSKLYWLNQRFAWEPIYKDRLLNVVQREDRIIDLKTGEIMARLVDYTTRNFSDSDTLSWATSMHHASCELGQRMPEQLRFNSYQQSVEQLGSKGNGNI